MADPDLVKELGENIHEITKKADVENFTHKPWPIGVPQQELIGDRVQKADEKQDNADI